MSATDHDLLGKFTGQPGSAEGQDSFTELVKRHLNLVYSAALRQVRSPQLAEEVAQSVFAHLACAAATLKPNTILTAWLYQVTRNKAIDVVRHEARRQAREQIAVQMSDINDSTADWMRIEPLLDEAMQSLEEPDRTAILLRYFENKSLREVGVALGASEDAAQKRVSRGVDRLRDFLSKRKLAVGTSGLAVLLSANAVQAAPTGLAAAIAASATLGASTISSSTAVAVTKTIAMTTLQKTVVTVVIAGALAVGIYQTRQASHLRREVQNLEEQAQQSVSLSNEVQELRRERDRATNALAALSAEKETPKKGPNEVLKLRGEVGRLRQEKAELGSSSALSKVTADPESSKMLRDQQKMGMSMLYKGFADRVKLSPEQTEKLNDLLADEIMEGVGHVTTALRDKAAPDQINQIFSAQEAALQDKVQEMFGADARTQFQDYTKNLLSTLTAEQFKGKLNGDDQAKADKVKQLTQLMQEQVQASLASAGLPSDYQMIPMLNFRNIASETEGEKSLKLLDDIYQQVAGRATTFLSPEEIQKFQDFKNAALKNNRSALAINRTMMAPISSK